MIREADIITTQFEILKEKILNLFLTHVSY